MFGTAPRQPCWIKKRAFTLIELMVVITIIGILGTLVVVRVIPLLWESEIAKIKTDLKSIVETARLIEVVTGSLPNSIEEMVQPKDENERDLPGLEELPLDPWDHPYQYELRDGQPVAICLGKDHLEGGDGKNADFQWPGGDFR